MIADQQSRQPPAIPCRRRRGASVRQGLTYIRGDWPLLVNPPPVGPAAERTGSDRRRLHARTQRNRDRVRRRLRPGVEQRDRHHPDARGARGVLRAASCRRPRARRRGEQRDGSAGAGDGGGVRDRPRDDDRMGALEMRARYPTIICALMLIALHCGCTTRVDMDDVYGKYVARYRFGTDTLELKKDGDYVQSAEIEGRGNLLVNRGKWEFDSEEQVVRLHGCLLLSDGFGALRSDYAVPLPGGCTYPVERAYAISGQIRLGPDEGFPHRKVAQ